jgi:hypothetical protein
LKKKEGNHSVDVSAACLYHRLFGVRCAGQLA